MICVTMTFNNVFVTVGTTEFDKLVTTVLEDDVVKALKNVYCKNLKIQYGSGKTIPALADPEINLECFRYKDSILEDISQADLVISHAGAGTCMDVLERQKFLITVVNDELMHNHQTELAEKLNSEGYSLYCNCNTLAETVNSIEHVQFKTFKYDYDRKCALYIEKLLQPEKAS